MSNVMDRDTVYVLRGEVILKILSNWYNTGIVDSQHGYAAKLNIHSACTVKTQIVHSTFDDNESPFWVSHQAG